MATTPPFRFVQHATFGWQQADFTTAIATLATNRYDLYVPDDQWWLLRAARLKVILITTNITNTDAIGAFEVERVVNLRSDSSDALGRRNGVPHRLSRTLIRLGAATDPNDDQPVVEYVPASPALLPPGCRLTLLAAAYADIGLVPTLDVQPNIDLELWEVLDGPTVEGAIAAPVINEWWNR